MLTAFLISIGVMCGISGLLAVLMIIADATIANYGEVIIDINDEKQLSVEGGRSLLATLKSEGVFVPSACGGRGSCGLCKVKILEGAGEVLPTELPWLTEEEKKDNVRISCQVKVKNNLRILVPDELLSVRQYKAQVASIRDLTHDIKELRLKLLDPDSMDFIPGQFVQLEVPPYEMSAEPVYRAYSISSDATDKTEIELEIRYVPNGICTTYVHKHLAVGDEVTLNGPYGDFYLRDTDRDIIFIAGGSGMAPIKSILSSMLTDGSKRHTHYFFGARTAKDLFLLDEMREIEDRLPDFKFIPALAEPPADWTGEKGLITEVVERHLDNLQNAEAYLCGSPLLIDACVKVLKDKGMPENLIYYDKFG